MSKHYVVHRNIPPSLAEQFKSHAPKGKLNGQTIHADGEGNLVGFISEMFMLDIFDCILPGSTIEDCAKESMDYDIKVDHHKVDVKAKMRTSTIRPDYDVSIAEYTIARQHCDIYAFCSVTFTKDKQTPLDFYFMGMMSKREFLTRAKVLKAGQPDGDNILPNGKPFVVRKDCRNMKCIDLKQYDYETLEPLKQGHYNLIAW